MDGIIIGTTIALCAAQVIAFIIVEPQIPIKLRETDNLQRIRKKKKNYLISIVILALVALATFYYGMFSQSLFFGMISVLFIVFTLIGMTKIIDRIEKKEKLFLAENIISDLKGSSIENIILKDEQLRKSVIMDGIQDIALQINLKTGKGYSTVQNVEQLISQNAVGKQSQEELLQNNFAGIEIEELEENEINLKVKTKTGNIFKKVIEKWELLQYIGVK